MEFRKLGGSGIAVSKIGLGCWSFGGGAYWGAQSQKDVDTVVAGALDSGINLFDTAEVYNDGASELSLGEALRGRREQAVIISKVKPSNAAPARLREACESSLKRLRTDYLDVYMLHWPINAQSVQHFTSDPAQQKEIASVQLAFDMLMELQREGKIRSIGVSNFGPQQLREALSTGARIDCLEIMYNLLSRAAERELVPLCARSNIGIVGYMALLQGLLSGKYTCVDQLSAPQAHSRHFCAARGGEYARHESEGAEELLFKTLRNIGELAGERGVPMPQLAIAWILAKSEISTTLVGCRNSDQLRQNMKAASLNLERDTIDKLDEITKPLWDRLGDNLDYYENPDKSRIF